MSAVWAQEGHALLARTMGALPSKPDDAADGPPNAFVVCELKDQMKLGGRMHNIVDSVMAGRVGHTATLTQIINPGDHTPHANTSNCDVFAVAADISRFRHSAQVEAKSADGVRLHIAFALGRLLPAARKGVDKIIVITSDTVLQAELDGVFEQSPERVAMIDPEALLRSEKECVGNDEGRAPTSSIQDPQRGGPAATGAATLAQAEGKDGQTFATVDAAAGVNVV